MRVFKWSTTFHSSEESPIVPVWVSLPFLPVHYMKCKEALYSIAATIGKPLRIDHATAAVSRPTVARVLIEYDISRPLLKRLWIGEKDTGFWQYIIFEKVPRYCAACKHVGHSDDTCYIKKPELREADRVGSVRQTVVPDGEGNKTKAPVKTQYVQKADNRNQSAATNEAATHSAQDNSTVASPVVHDVPTTSAKTSEAPNEVTTIEATQVIMSDPPAVADIPPPRHGSDVPDPAAAPDLTHESQDTPHAPDMTPEPWSLGIQIVDSGSPITRIFPVEVEVPDAATASATTDIPSGDHDRTVVGFNTHCTDIPSSEATSDAVETSDAEETTDEEETSDTEQQHLGHHDPGRPGPDPDFSDSQQFSRKGFDIISGLDNSRYFSGI
ncbi:hypothetical protein AB3S75_041270 [Citrus x aurantiifolia]